MSLSPVDVFVVLKWPIEAGFPRYSFATMVHAAEIHNAVERVHTCSSLEQAAAMVDRLNVQEAAAAA